MKDVPPINIDLLRYAEQQQIRTQDDRKEIWDNCRRKYVRLLPEELVRQCLVSYLIEIVNVGQGRMITERGLLNYQNNRFDLGVKNVAGRWSLLAECKSFRDPLNVEAVFQAAKYNASLHAEYILITNGKASYLWCTNDEPRWITEESRIINNI